MFEDRWHVSIQYDMATDGLSLYISQRNQIDPNTGEDTGKPHIWVADPVTFSERAVGKAEPLVTVSRRDRDDNIDLIQQIVDTAFEIGIRPKKMKAHDSELAAVRYHLEDMRTLAKVSPKK